MTAHVNIETVAAPPTISDVFTGPGRTMVALRLAGATVPFGYVGPGIMAGHWRGYYVPDGLGSYRCVAHADSPTVHGAAGPVLNAVVAQYRSLVARIDGLAAVFGSAYRCPADPVGPCDWAVMPVPTSGGLRPAWVAMPGGVQARHDDTAVPTADVAPDGDGLTYVTYVPGREYQVADDGRVAVVYERAPS